MIQGYFKPAGITSRPYMQALFQFPSRGPRQVAVELLVDHTDEQRTVSRTYGEPPRLQVPWFVHQ